MGILPNSTGMVPGWSPTKIVQMVLIGCKSRSQGQKKGFQNAATYTMYFDFELDSNVLNFVTHLPLHVYFDIFDNIWIIMKTT